MIQKKSNAPGNSAGDPFIPKRWRSPTTFEKVTFSPSQKGHFESPGNSAVLTVRYLNFNSGNIDIKKTQQGVESMGSLHPTLSS